MARTIWNMAGAAVALLGLPAEPAQAQGGQVVTASSIGEPVEANDYRWIDRAHAMWDAIGDAPPDYRFRFGGGEPWAWETRDGFWVVVEDRPEGTRTYFFAPGDRGPFVVREADRSFGYEAGHVAVVYNGSGMVLPRYQGAPFLNEGEDLYRRGRRLRDALIDRQWQPVDTTAWADVNLFFIGIDQRWDSNWRRADYDGYARVEQQRWAAERARRAAMAAAFAQWRSGGFQGPPPPGIGRHWMHGPGRPAAPPPRPPIAGQPVPPPGSGWTGGPGRPDRPTRPGGWGGRPGTPPPPPQPGAGAPEAPPSPPPASAAPGWQRPDRPGWQGGRPGWQGGARPDLPARPVPPPAAAAPAPQPAAPPSGVERPEPRRGWMTPNWLRNAATNTPSAPPARPASPPPAPAPRAAPPAAHVAPPPPRPSAPAARMIERRPELDRR